jgi:hypothetical protein
MRIDLAEIKPSQSWLPAYRRIDVILDEKEAHLLIAKLAAQLADLRLLYKSNPVEPGNLTADLITLTVSVVPSMAHTAPGTDPVR